MDRVDPAQPGPVPPWSRGPSRPVSSLSFSFLICQFHCLEDYKWHRCPVHGRPSKTVCCCHCYCSYYYTNSLNCSFACVKREQSGRVSHGAGEATPGKVPGQGSRHGGCSTAAIVTVTARRAAPQVPAESVPRARPAPSAVHSKLHLILTP